TDCKTILTKLITTFVNAFNSEFKERIQNYTRFDDQSFQDAMICNIDSMRKYMLEIIIHQQQTSKLLMQTQEDHSNTVQEMNVDSLKVDLVVIQSTCSEKEDCNSETASSKSVKESSLNSKPTDAHAIKYKIQYDRRLNKRQMQVQKSKIDTGKVVDADLVVTERNGTES
nr:hypothetical protein [Tanacetum cinerariifolium]